MKNYKSLRKANKDSMKSDGRKVNWSTISKYIDTGTLCTLGDPLSIDYPKNSS